MSERGSEGEGLRGGFRSLDASGRGTGNEDHRDGEHCSSTPPEASARNEDLALAALASRQHGVVSSAQLHALGLTRREIERRVLSGRLHRLHRSVFAVGHTALPTLGREAAALLACGPRASLTNETAACLWRLPLVYDGPVHVTVPTKRRSRPGIVVHRSTTLTDRDIRRHQGLSLTAPARTILDIEAGLDARTLERVVADALARRLVNAEELKSSPRLKALLDEGPKMTRSEAERRMLDLVRRAGLPEPQTNSRVGPFEVDLLWPDHRVAVEVDGFAFHGHRIAFERDHRRDLALQAHGLHTIRVTWRQIAGEPEWLAASLGAALAQAARARA